MKNMRIAFLQATEKVEPSNSQTAKAVESVLNKGKYKTIKQTNSKSDMLQSY